MRLLLFSIPIIYSFIFFIFYNLSNWLDVFWNNLNIWYNLITLSTNLLFETVVFFIIGVIFYGYFIDLSWGKISNNKNTYDIFIYKKYMKNIFYIIISFTLFFITSYLLNIIINNKALLLNLTWILFNVLFYFIFVKFYFFKKIKLTLKKLSLIFIYISSISWIYYLYFFDINYIILFTIFYSILFNFKIHYKYTNIISLVFWVILLIFTIYYLFFINF